MSVSKFGIVITAKMRHGDLWEAVRRVGSVTRLGAALGMSYRVLYGWVNLKAAPSLGWLESDAGRKVSDNLLLYCGKTPSELWPPELRAAIKGGEVGRRIERRADVELRALAEGFSQRLILPSPEKKLEEEESVEALESMLGRLQPRRRLAVAMRFGLDGYSPSTFEEIGVKLKVSKSRASQIFDYGMSKLRTMGCTLTDDAKAALGVDTWAVPENPVDGAGRIG